MYQILALKPALSYMWAQFLFHSEGVLYFLMYANDSGRVGIIFGKFPMDTETTETEAFKIILSIKQ